jgi:Rrf2 family protein
MKLPKKCLYALRAVFELAVRQAVRPVKIHDLASSQGIPARFLEVILNELRHAGLVRSSRGRNGGYLLAVGPEKLTVGDVIKSVDGPFSAGQPRDREPPGLQGQEALRYVWTKVDQAVLDVLDTTTFADLVSYEAQHGRQYLPSYAI